MHGSLQRKVDLISGECILLHIPKHTRNLYPRVPVREATFQSL